jgi:CDP-paratose 2-epimerase
MTSTSWPRRTSASATSLAMTTGPPNATAGQYAGVAIKIRTRGRYPCPDMPTAIITGAGGLVGSESAAFFAGQGFSVVGIENDMRARLFGPGASVRDQLTALTDAFDSIRVVDPDIRDFEAVERIFAAAGDVELVIHTAAQPSHDWAATDPQLDFAVNATGTLNVLEATRRHAPEATFIFTSTNKVYGDTPNRLPLVELDTRLELPEEHRYHRGVDTTMSIDTSLHSLFGVSKASADLLVQEYGRYFGLRTVSFRGGCLTGPRHAGARLHGFLSYLMRCTITGEAYTVYGYGGRQVRDNLHSADLVRAFAAFHANPRSGAVYNIGGGRHSNCSMLEAIELCQHIAGRPLEHTIVDDARVGDHRWWISDLTEFQRDYPDWSVTYDVPAILAEIHEYNADRWAAEPSSTAGAR